MRKPTIAVASVSQMTSLSASDVINNLRFLFCAVCALFGGAPLPFPLLRPPCPSAAIPPLFCEWPPAPPRLSCPARTPPLPTAWSCSPEPAAAPSPFIPLLPPALLRRLHLLRSPLAAAAARLRVPIVFAPPPNKSAAAMIFAPPPK